MTISKVLALVDEIDANTYDTKTKIGWLSKLDGRVFNDIILTHEHELVDDGTEEGNLIEPTFSGYSDASLDTELLIADTYSDVYTDYLMAMIAYSNGETERYQNSMIMFNSNYREYTNWYNRTHKPIQLPLKVFNLGE
jgi:hypothetical protein